MLYGIADCPGCRENFPAALAGHGLGRRDIVPNINFFCNVPVDADTRYHLCYALPGRLS